MSIPDDDVDFALAIHRSGGSWHVDELTRDHLEDLGSLVAALRRFPPDPGAVGLVAVDEDFFVVVRVTGSSTRVLLSDVTAARDWDLADSVLAFLGLPSPDDEDPPVAAGDFDLLADLGLPEVELAMLLDDIDLYPDELLSDVATRLGFGALFDDAVGLTTV